MIAVSLLQLGDGASQWGDITQWWDSLLDPFFGLLGPLFPMAVALILVTMAYVFTGSFALPAVFGIVIGGFIVTLLPAPAQVAAQLVIFAAFAIGVYLVFIDRGQGGRL